MIWLNMFVIGCGFILIGQLMLLAHSELIYKIEQVQCNYNPKYAVNVSCRLQPVNWHKTLFNMDATLVRTLRNISLHSQATYKNTANRYQPFLINVTNNLCDVLAKRSFPTIATIIVNMYKEFTNINHSCPYKGHLITKDFWVDAKWSPMPMPLGKYKSYFRFLEGFPYEDIGTVTLYFDVADVQPRRPRVKHPKADKNNQ